jgi:cyanosortase A-associated protein
MSDPENKQFAEQLPEPSTDASVLAEQVHSLKQERIRIGLLGVVFSGALIIFGKSLFDPNLGKPLSVNYPERIELTSAQPLPPDLPVQIIDEQKFYNKPKYLSGHRYKYVFDGININIDLRYAYRTNGDVFLFLRELAKIDFDTDKMRSQVSKNDLGYYFTFEHQDRLYLTACINPRGVSTVTTEQFEDNASERALDGDVLMSWLLGQKDLRDRRCLWTLMSTPKPANGDRQVIEQKLQTVWSLWYGWWQNRFPYS